MNFTIRVLKGDEIDEEFELIASIFPDADPEIEADDIILIAESTNGRPLGFLHLAEDDDNIFLEGLGVDESSRGAGIGSALMEKMLMIVSRSDKPIILKTTMSNPALELYNNFGFAIKRFGNVHVLERKGDS